ncbi:MAG TPA: M67 family metallopeptidase [Candidatus Binatia bacterium]|nr:M67 family metallopeptidase [Candidatus Binatia bacterium]
MNPQMEFCLSEKAWNEIAQHAQETFPEECCGVVITDGAVDRIHRLKNIQNQLHALDPQTYPRTAAIAYAMDYKELERVIDEAKRNGAKLKAFYHSHPNHDAYFSAEDKAFASPFGEPTFPGTAQIVVSIYDGAIKEVGAFAWSDQEEDFVQVTLTKT